MGVHGDNSVGALAGRLRWLQSYGPFTSIFRTAQPHGQARYTFIIRRRNSAIVEANYVCHSDYGDEAIYHNLSNLKAQQCAKIGS